MLKRLADLSASRPSIVIAIWLLVMVGLVIYGPSAERMAERDTAGFLAPHEPSEEARTLEAELFPDVGSPSRTVFVFERDRELTDADEAYIREISERLAERGRKLGRWRVISPMQQPYLRRRLISPDGRAAMVIVNGSLHWATFRSGLDVKEMDLIARADPPPGLTIEVTGPGGLGRDLGEAGERALHRTTWVTVTVVLVILLVVYRAPLAAMVPLVSVGLTVTATLHLLDFLSLAGWSISAMEKTFAVVLLYGSGVDFAMFWMARYREEAERDSDLRAAAARATAAVAPAIIASAGTTIAGLSMLIMADFIPSKNAGRVLAVALSMSLFAALTLIPAVARRMGGLLFWPSRIAASGGWRQPKMSRLLARGVTGGPVVAIAVCMVVLAWPVIDGTRVSYRYDGLGVAPPGSSTERGQQIAERHFSSAQLYSWSCLVELERPLVEMARQVRLAERVADALAATAGVADVWGLVQPLGRGSRASVLDAAASRLARPSYVTQDGRYMRWEVLQQDAPFSNTAIVSQMSAMSAVSEAVVGAGVGPAKVRAAGMTPYIVNIKEVTDRDHRRVTWLVLCVIFAILVIWLRRLALPLVMVAATLMVYYATLGVTEIVFRDLLGHAGIDWKLRLILFVILVAVGQDYNIFIVSRIVQERRTFNAREAVGRAIGRTGAVISSCGVIMAATLGSLMAAGLPLYTQLGFAFAFGVLLDTFVIRPVVVPSAYLVLERLRRGASADRT
jgi:RND superfamily putative drug exporter